MNTTRKHKLILIISCLSLLGVGSTFILTALSKNINLFFTPTQIVAGEAPKNTVIRVGGLVVAQSIQRGKGVDVIFRVTDTVETVTVRYSGILPDLFREGQAAVVKGRLSTENTLVASEVLAKHDENYMPPEAAEAIMRAQNNQNSY